jgi:nitronate monooxygenase
MWPDRRLLDLFGIEIPLLQAPMAGACGPEMTIAVCEAGGLGGLPAAVLSPETLHAQIGAVRERTDKPFNVNFFCHQPADSESGSAADWMGWLAGYYREFGLAPESPTVNFPPFGEAMCAVVEALKPAVVSFHFGLPEAGLLARVKAAGCTVLSSATTVAEARWLVERGCDAIVAQGYEAGGHRGMFRTADLTTQVGTFSLLPQVLRAVKLPVVAAGGIADAQGVAALLAMGAAGVQVGTAYLLCPEAITSTLQRAALKSEGARHTALTNVFTGRPSRGIVNRVMRELGMISGAAPDFPLATAAIAPLRAKAEAAGSGDFTPLWSGQNATGCREIPAAQLTRELAAKL